MSHFQKEIHGGNNIVAHVVDTQYLEFKKFKVRIEEMDVRFFLAFEVRILVETSQSHLYDSLSQNNDETFIDNTELKKGDDVLPTVINH